MDHIFAVLNQEQNLVLSTELVSHFLDAFECDFSVGVAIFSFEDVAWMGGGVPKHPEPMMRLML